MSDRIFRRKIYDSLLKWKTESKGRSALLIEGARRIGKTTVVREFASREYASYIIIDFIQPLPGTIEIFENYRHDVGLLTSNLAILYQVELRHRDSVIIFDEVQKYPKARELIKYLVMDGRYDYIETGSLISIRKNVKDIQIPSEEEPLRMYPMDFEEWLWVNGDNATMDVIRDHFERIEPLGKVMHDVIMSKYRMYMVTGGMPGAVAAFIDDHEITSSESVKRQIINLYRNDIRKNDTNPDLTVKVFDHIPALLSKRNKVFRPGTLKEEGGGTTRDYSDVFEFLCDSRIVNKCVSNTDPDISMNLSNDERRVKLYILDTGLLMTLAFDTGDMDATALVSMAKGKLNINEGMLFENMVSQELISSGHKLYFNEFYGDKDKKYLYEVDFILVKGRKIIPVEVKSSSSKGHISFDLFREKYKRRIGMSYVIHSKDLEREEGVVYIPIYMASLL